MEREKFGRGVRERACAVVGSAGSLRTSGARSMIGIYDEKGAARNEQFRVALSHVHVIGSLQFFISHTSAPEPLKRHKLSWRITIHSGWSCNEGAGAGPGMQQEARCSISLCTRNLVAIKWGSCWRFAGAREFDVVVSRP